MCSNKIGKVSYLDYNKKKCTLIKYCMINPKIKNTGDACF